MRVRKPLSRSIQNTRRCAWQQIREGKHLTSALEIRRYDFEGWLELCHYLAACPAGTDRCIGIGDDGHATKVPLSRHHSRSDCHPLGAHRQPETQVLDIASCKNCSIGALEGRSDGEVRIGGMRCRASCNGCIDESWAFHVLRNQRYRMLCRWCFCNFNRPKKNFRMAPGDHCISIFDFGNVTGS